MTDLIRDYRICAYHIRPDLGPHVHHPLDSKDSFPTQIDDETDAAFIARKYAEGHQSFDRKSFEEEVRQWKSGSKHG